MARPRSPSSSPVEPSPCARPAPATCRSCAARTCSPRFRGSTRVAEVEPIDWGLVPASHLSFAQVLDIGRILARELARPEIDGAVVVQGTDVIEETAFAWDLLPLPPKPVVVVGAMRSASQEGYDGPENLRNALVAAADPALATCGRRRRDGRRDPRGR